IHGLSLIGETPYGNLDSAASIRRLGGETELTYYTLGLTDGKFGPFNGFNIRGFDYSPYFSNLALPGANLRGVMLNSPAFDKKIDYTAFWGRESGGIYGLFSTSLGKSKHSFLEGVNLSYSPKEKSNYKFTIVHGWGRDRADYLPSYDYDLSGSWIFGKGGLTYELANDSNNFAQLLTARYMQPKIHLSAELRNVDKDFYSISGRGWRAGEIGGLFNLNYNPTEKLSLNGLLDIYQDRLYPAEDNDRRWNEDLSLYSNYIIDPLTSLRINYALQNDLGKLSQYRYQTVGAGINRRVKFIKDIMTYADYSHQENKSFATPSADYINDRIFMGLRFSLIGELYYYINKEFNWLQDRFAGSRTEPNVLETGLDWSGQLGKSPFYGDLRFTYHDEEDSQSNLSFLSGQDYIEGYSELSYRMSPANEIFGSIRMRNIWADNTNVTKRVEANFYAGMRYTWDTGVRWESVGNIEGYVFKDLNSDGLRQRDEAPIEGIRMWLGKEKSVVTDMFGYYKFKGVKARKAYVSMDTSTLPSGFVLTVPMVQEAGISHHRTIKLDFGIVSRSEISGVVFEDIDGDGQFGRNDKGVKGIVLILDDKQKVMTDSAGRYAFSRASVGEHTVSLDLKSVATFYLPKTTLTKKITLFEGVTYIHNIPLRRIKK
ncbi:MAG: SdrD B-like domain-containing protein, partial [Candidatus Omnitrophota bacterium]